MTPSELPDQPHSLWATLRATCPVARVESASARPTFYVTRAADVEAVLLDAETFSSSINAENIGRFMGPIMLAMDGEEHFAHRQLMAGAFRPSQLAKWEVTLIRPTIDRLIDAIAPSGRADLVAEVTSRFPAQVICGIFGLPPQDGGKLFAWTLVIHRGAQDPEAGLAAARAIREYLEPIVEERRAHPVDDLISDIVHAQVDGQRLSDEEIYGFLRLLLPAGSESTYRALGTALLALLTVPGLLERVRADRSRIPAVVEETIRWDVSNTLASRVATRDTTIAGCPIPAGAALLVVTGSANRDETRFANPDVFDLERPTKRLLSFGMGRHHCLGQHLARLELRVALNAILDRLGNLRLDPNRPPPVVEGFSFRGPASLHVLFNS